LIRYRTEAQFFPILDKALSISDIGDKNIWCRAHLCIYLTSRKRIKALSCSGTKHGQVLARTRHFYGFGVNTFCANSTARVDMKFRDKKCLEILHQKQWLWTVTKITQLLTYQVNGPDREVCNVFNYPNKFILTSLYESSDTWNPTLT
jgi:hypothetical protein